MREGRPNAAMLLGSAISIGGAAAWTQPAVGGSDLWWHLAAGREISQIGRVPSVDSFSHTFAGEPWVNHEWLWDLVFWGAYAVEPEAVAWLNFAILLVLLALVHGTAWSASRSLLAAGAATWLVAAASHWFLDIRPHVVTLLFTALLLATRRWRFAPWLWPPLFVVWVNVHAGFVFGLGVIGLQVGIDTLERCARARRIDVVPGPWLGVLLACAATLVNPWSFHIVEYPLALLDGDSPYRAINEWLPPALSLSWRDYSGRFFWGSAFALLGAPLAWRRDRTLLAVALVAFAMALTSRRFIPLFSLVVAPLWACAVGFAQARVVHRRPALGTRRSRFAALAASALCVVWLWSGVRLAPEWLYRWTAGSFYPEAAVTYLRAMGGAERLLNLYSWGGYLTLHAPDVPVFVDGRALTVYDDALYEDYLRLQEGATGLRGRLADHGVDAVLFPPGTPLVARLLQSPDPWVPVYQDRAAVLLLPPGAPRSKRGLPRPSEVVGDHPDRRLYAARRAAERSEFDDATQRLEAVLAEHPLMIPAYGELAMLHARRARADEIAGVIERGRRAAPRYLGLLRELEGRAYAEAGELERARDALDAAQPRGPFQTVSRLDEELALIERRIEWRRSGFQGEAPR
jgi:tetratricopeptide (TPR) repeat protein